VLWERQRGRVDKEERKNPETEHARERTKMVNSEGVRGCYSVIG
jgi:hypothetical protein